MQILAPLIKNLVETALEAEMDSHIAKEVLKNKETNRRNGYNRKIVKSTAGLFELSTLKDL